MIIERKNDTSIQLPDVIFCEIKSQENLMRIASNI